MVKCAGCKKNILDLRESTFKDKCPHYVIDENGLLSKIVHVCKECGRYER